MLACGVCNAGTLITRPDAALWLNNVTYTGQVLAKMGDASVAAPAWIIVQWSNPSPLTANQDYAAAPNTNWAFSNSSTRVQFYALPDSQQNIIEHTLEFYQNGLNNPCGNEFDLAASTGTDNQYNDPSGKPIARRMSISAPINQLNTVALLGGVTIPYESAVPTQQCNNNLAGYGFNIVLNSTNGYVLFFQIFVRTSNGAVQNNSPCGGYPNGKNYCFTSNVSALGVELSDQSVSQTRVFYNFNVLPQLRKAIAMTPDTNLGDWQIRGSYFGQNVLGGASANSRWDSFTIMAF